MNVPRSVISAKVRLALRCRSTLSEKTRVLRARRGSPEKKSVSPRCAGSQQNVYAIVVDAARTFSRYCSRSATASLSLSARTGSYRPSRDLPARHVSMSSRQGSEVACREKMSRYAPPQHEDPQLPMAEGLSRGTGGRC